MTVGLPLPVIPLFVHQELGFGNTVVGVAVGIQFLATVLTRGTPDVWQTSTALNVPSCRGCWPAPGGRGMAGRCAAAAAGARRLGLLLLGRLILGFGESQLLTGNLSWGWAGGTGPFRQSDVMERHGDVRLAGGGRPAGIIDL